MKWNLQKSKKLRAQIQRRLVMVIVVVLGAFVLTSGTALAQTTCTDNPTTTVNTAGGTWSLSPAISNTYQTQVNQPINSDGSSNFPAKRGVIPVSFSLFTAPGAPTFQSIGSDGYSGSSVGTGSNYANDCSFLYFKPNTSLTFNQLTALAAVYTFTAGDCHGGSLRWTVTTDMGNVFIYYGLQPQVGNGGTGGCTTGSVDGQNQSGTNLIGNSVIQYDTSGIAGGTYYSNYTGANALVGTHAVLSVSLNLESGWQQSDGDQILTLGNVNVSTSLPSNDTFSPPTGPATQTCTLPTAQIQVVKTSGPGAGAIDEVLSVQPADQNGVFRIVSCKYIYNLDVSSLKGAGGYSVSAVINGTPASNSATFMLK